MILIDVLENDYLLNTYCRSGCSRKLGYAVHAVQPLSFRLLRSISSIVPTATLRSIWSKDRVFDGKYVECPNLFDRARSIFHPLGSSRRRNRSSSSMPRTRGSSSAPRRRFSSREFGPIDGSSFIHVTCVTCPVAGEITIRQAHEKSEDTCPRIY